VYTYDQRPGTNFPAENSRIKDILHVAKGLLTDLQKSPYRDRIFAVIDSVHGQGLRGSLL